MKYSDFIKEAQTAIQNGSTTFNTLDEYGKDTTGYMTPFNVRTDTIREPAPCDLFGNLDIGDTLVKREHMGYDKKFMDSIRPFLGTLEKTQFNNLLGNRGQAFRYRPTDLREFFYRQYGLGADEANRVFNSAIKARFDAWANATDVPDEVKAKIAAMKESGKIPPIYTSLMPTDKSNYTESNGEVVGNKPMNLHALDTKQLYNLYFPEFAGRSHWNWGYAKVHPGYYPGKPRSYNTLVGVLGEEGFMHPLNSVPGEYNILTGNREAADITLDLYGSYELSAFEAARLLSAAKALGYFDSQGHRHRYYSWSDVYKPDLRIALESHSTDPSTNNNIWDKIVAARNAVLDRMNALGYEEADRRKWQELKKEWQELEMKRCRFEEWHRQVWPQIMDNNDGTRYAGMS